MKDLHNNHFDFWTALLAFLTLIIFILIVSCVPGYGSDTIEDYCGNQGNFVEGYVYSLFSDKRVEAVEVVTWSATGCDFEGCTLITNDDDSYLTLEAADSCLTLEADSSVVLYNDIVLGDYLKGLEKRITKLEERKPHSITEHWALAIALIMWIVVVLIPRRFL